MLFNEDFARRFAELDVNLMISIDGADRETYEKIRRGASFEELKSRHLSRILSTSSTNSSISIEDYSGKNIDIKSFEWSEGNTMVGVKIDTLDYLTEYRVTITDDAMSVDSVRLVRKSLPKNFNMYRIS